MAPHSRIRIAPNGRHSGYSVSRHKRNRIGEPIGWGKMLGSPVAPQREEARLTSPLLRDDASIQIAPDEPEIPRHSRFVSKRAERRPIAMAKLLRRCWIPAAAASRKDTSGPLPTRLTGFGSYVPFSNWFGTPNLYNARHHDRTARPSPCSFPRGSLAKTANGRCTKAKVCAPKNPVSLPPALPWINLSIFWNA
jgi:hypothetical protein